MKARVPKLNQFRRQIMPPIKPSTLEPLLRFSGEFMLHWMDQKERKALKVQPDNPGVIVVIC